MIDDYLLYKNIPSIDLHGENKESALYFLNDFIDDNIMLKNELIKIIHGKGKYILKKAIHDDLRKNRRVKEYKTDIYNDGVTIVLLNIKK